MPGSGRAYTRPMTDPTDTTAARDHAGWSRTLLVGVASVAVCACGAASIGEPGPVPGSASVLYLVLTQGSLAGIYLLGAFGLGLGLVKLLARDVSAPGAAAAGLGLAVMLTITHLLGVTGTLSSRVAAVVPVAIGVAIVARSIPQLLASARHMERPSLLWLAGVPAAGVLLAAACSPPGWLWSSEFGGYDTLVYHLQLPREWHAAGRVWPLEHNVYSYLPSYVESSFAHLASLAGVPRESFVSEEGELLIACKLLHAGMTLLAGWTAAGAVRSLLGEAGDRSRTTAAVAGVLVIATPWSVVTGSMAYNEMAMLALLLSAVHFGAARELTAWKRGLLAGVLVGVACGCKPTALLLGAPAVGLLMLATMPRSAWLAGVGAGAVAGVVMLAPWLARNTMAGGNPVFPMLTSVFGSAHWSGEQIERYTSAHRFDGSAFDAIRLLVMGDPDDPAALPGRPVHRGLLHPQWAFTVPILVLSAVLAVASRKTRLIGITLVLGFAAQIAVWATTTHVQSRFLVPVLVPVSLLAASAAGVLLDWVARLNGPTRGVRLTLGAGLLATSAMTVGLFAGENRSRGGPNTLIGFGSPYFTNFRIHDENPELAPPDAYLRAMLPEGATLLTVGDSSPLYKPDGVQYATTYDQSPLAAALRAHPNDPRGALALLDATHLYVDWIELSRLWRTGWADPELNPQRLQNLLMAHALVEHSFMLGPPGGERFVAQELYRLPGATP